MIYFLGLSAVFLIIFAVQKARTLRDISALFKSLSFFKLHYLVLGIILVFFFPDNFTSIFESTRESIIMFCLFWIGLYYGCGLELRAHQRFSLKVIMFNIFEPVIIFASITLIGVLYLFLKYGKWEYTSIAVITGIFCSFTIFRRHGILIREGDSSHHPILDDLLPVGNIFAVTILSIAGTLFFKTQDVLIAGHYFTGIFSKFILTILMGVAGGMLLNILISSAESTDAKSIILVGGSALIGGMAYFFSFSPLFVGTVSGAFLINATLKRLQTLSALNMTNEIIERIFMFVLGTVLSPLIIIFKNNLMLILFYALLIFVLRASLKYILSFYWISGIKGEPGGSSLIWIGLTGQGILSSAAAFECSSYLRIIPSIFIFFVILLVLNQLTVGFYVWYKEKGRQ